MSPDSSVSLIHQITALEPSVFENLTFDLLVSRGLRNVVWRTPGPDGGRDIEGEFSEVDFSGFERGVRWYVECKRYSSSVDWPTVWKKLAYADSHGAANLLMVTSAHLTPVCKSEIQKWNDKSREPRIRFWDGPMLEVLVSRCPAILTKYGLASDSRSVAVSFVELVQYQNRMLLSAYGDLVFSGERSTALEAASAFAELHCIRLADIEAGGFRPDRQFRIPEDVYDWIDSSSVDSTSLPFDRFALRAVLAALRHVIGANSMHLSQSTDTQLVVRSKGRYELTHGAVSMIETAAFWGNFEVEHATGEIRINSRDCNSEVRPTIA